MPRPVSIIVLLLTIALLVASIGGALSQAGPFLSVSAATSSSINTPTQLVPALSSPNGRRKIMIRNEGAAVVCFSQFTATPTAGSPGTFCLKGGSAPGDGLGSTYNTPAEMSDPNAIWMVSGTASVPVTAWIQ